MTKLVHSINPEACAALNGLRESKLAQANAAKRAAAIEDLARTQDDELPLASQEAQNIVPAIGAHDTSGHHRWLTGRSRQDGDPAQLFSDYRSGDTSDRWKGLVTRAEIDPKRER